MITHIRELNTIELLQISGGMSISPSPGGQTPTLPIDDLGDNGAYIPVGRGGRNWWKLPGGGIDPVVPVPKPEPGKP